MARNLIDKYKIDVIMVLIFRLNFKLRNKIGENQIKSFFIKLPKHLSIKHFRQILKINTCLDNSNKIITQKEIIRNLFIGTCGIISNY